MKSLGLQLASGDTQAYRNQAVKIFKHLLKEECYKSEINYAMNG